MRTLSVADLIKRAKVNPPEVVIEGLLHFNDVMLIHGEEEVYKSFFVFQMAEALATGTPFLRQFCVKTPRRVGIVATELHEHQLGIRLGTMFPDGRAPGNVLIFGDMATFRRTPTMDERFRLVRDWTSQERIDVLILDIASDFFRGQGSNPKDEQAVAAFFEHVRRLPVSAVLVRHDHKPRQEDFIDTNANNRIRGSGEWKEDPEAILHLQRTDRRLSQVRLEVGKLRYGMKPDPVELWFDATTFRLTPLPPVIAVLESRARTRAQLVAECRERFNLSPRKTDDMVKGLKAVLIHRQKKHEKQFEIDWSAVTTMDDDGDDEPQTWCRILREARAEPLTVGDVQDCTTSSLQSPLGQPMSAPPDDQEADGAA